MAKFRPKENGNGYGNTILLHWTPGLERRSKDQCQKPLKQRQIWAIRFFLDGERRMRDRAMFDLAIDSKLRGCDLVKIKIGALVTGPEIRSRAMVVQQKTGRPVQFRRSRQMPCGTVDDYAFPSRVDHRSLEHTQICSIGR
jgi:hypothetical protein